MKKINWILCLGLAMLFPAAGMADPVLEAADPADAAINIGVMPQPVQPPENMTGGGAFIAMPQSAQLPDYWLGIQLSPVLPALSAQLHLPQHQGLLIESVVPDGPAAKAGLAQYDIVLKADGKDLADIPDILKAVDAAKDKEMKLEIIREGQPKTISVTPVKRPDAARLPAQPPANDLEALRDAIESMRQSFDVRGPGSQTWFQLMRPGLILPPGASLQAPLPGNMSISISKSGDKPADITVRMGDKKWEVTEKELDKLPEDVRPHVERMLGLASGAERARPWVPEVINPAPRPTQPQAPAAVPGLQPFRNRTNPNPNISAPPRNNLEERIETRLEEMKQHIQKLENELHQRRGELKPPEPAPAPIPTPEKSTNAPDPRTL